jgi:hypothetical protein
MTDPSLLFTWIETHMNRSGLIKNCPTDPFQRPDQKAGCDLFARHTYFCQVNSIHPTTVRFHRPEDETVKELKFVRQPRRDEQ